MKSKHMKKRCSYNGTYPFIVSICFVCSHHPRIPLHTEFEIMTFRRQAAFSLWLVKSLGAPDRLRLASGGTAAYVPDGPYIRLLR